MRTPCYSYDLALLRKTVEAAKEAAAKNIPGAHIHYAVKANNNPKILSTISALGLGCDCVSGGEINQALAAGFPAGEVVFAGVGKIDREINMALDGRIGCFNVESLPELEVINQLASLKSVKARVAIRVNPDVGAHTHANITTGLAENKFGINLEQLPEILLTVAKLPAIELKGLHFHIGSQILDMTDFQALCNRINDLQKELQHLGVTIRSINVGGGLGIDYEHPELHPIPDFDAYFKTFADHLKLYPDQEFHCELGRSIVGQCGSLLTRCTFVKEGSYKKFVIVDAGMNDLIRPALYHAVHKIENVSSPEGEPVLYDVVGPICESSDVFAKALYLPEVKRGDILAIRSAGAYGESMASRYNTRDLPASEFN